MLNTARESGAKVVHIVNDGGEGTPYAGFMTHMCVTFTAQGAFNLGYRPTVVADATATRSLAGPDGAPQPAETLQAAALTTIGDLFGVVVPNAEAFVRS